MSDTIMFNVVGHILPADEIQAIKSLKSNDKLIFDEIRATCPDCRIRRLPPLVITIK